MQLIDHLDNELVKSRIMKKIKLFKKENDDLTKY